MNLFSHMPALKLVWSKGSEWVWSKGNARVRGGEFVELSDLFLFPNVLI